MEPKLVAIAKKIYARPALYTYLGLLYWSRATRKRAYRDIATELVQEGTVRRITPAQVKKTLLQAARRVSQGTEKDQPQSSIGSSSAEQFRSRRLQTHGIYATLHTLQEQHGKSINLK